MGHIFYVASHTPTGGIYCFEIDDNAKLSLVNRLSVGCPAYAVISGEYLFAVLREPFLYNSGAVKYRINKDFSLTQEGDIVSTHGFVAAHICIDGDKIYCPNYTSGSTICLPDKIALHNGSSVNPERQTSSHPHQVLLTPDGKYIAVNDLGTDKIMLFDKELKNELSFAKVPDGSGARHGIFSPDGKYYYCAGEMGSDLSIFSYADGSLCYIKTLSTLPKGFSQANTASAVRYRNGKIYVSNRGADCVCVFGENGENTEQEGFFGTEGNSPREMNFVGDFLVCGNENSNDITVFRMKDDGMAEYTGTKYGIDKPWGIVEYK